MKKGSRIPDNIENLQFFVHNDVKIFQKRNFMKTLPAKSYMDPAERAQLLADGMSMNSIYVCEAEEAKRSGDQETFWQWLSLAVLPAASLRIIRRSKGSDFIRKMGFDTTLADVEYGSNWLDEPYVR